MLARQALQSPHDFFQLFGQRALAARVRGSAGSELGAPPQPLDLALLAPGELTQLLERLVERIRRRIALAALHVFVLVAELVHFEPEQVGEILFGVGSRTAAPARARASDLYLTKRRLRPLQMLQRLARGRQRRVRITLTQCGLGFAHAFNRLG